jgi:hypothetical protein
MATPERNMWTRVIDGLYTTIGPKHLRLQRIENGTANGIPDVMFSAKWRRKKRGGWIELKRVREYPKRSNTPIRIDHFTKEQKLFMRLHGRITGSVYLLLLIESDWYIFDHVHIDKIGETATRFDLMAMSVHWWPEKCDWRELFEVLVR